MSVRCIDGVMEHRCITSELCSKHSPVTSDSSSKHSYITSESSWKDGEITSESSRKDSEVTLESSRKDSEITSESSRKQRHTTSKSSSKHRHTTTKSSRKHRRTKSSKKHRQTTSEKTRKDSEITSESSRKHRLTTSKPSRKHRRTTSKSSKKHRHTTLESTSKHSDHTSGSSRKDSEITLASSGKHSGITSESSREHCPSRSQYNSSSSKGACYSHLRNSPLSSRQLVGCSRSYQNNTVKRSGNMASVQKSHTCHSERSSEANSADQSSRLASSSSSSCAKISAASGSNMECAVKEYIPLIIDVTGICRSKGTNLRKVCSVLDTIMDETSECIEMDRELDYNILKAAGRKRRLADSLTPQTVKANSSDTLATCIHKQKRWQHQDTSAACKHKKKCSQHEHDTSVITLGSDDEVEIIGSDLKTRLSCSSKTDVDPKPQLDHSSVTDVVFDTLHKRKPETVIIDLCSPSVNSKCPELTQKYTNCGDNKTSISKQTCSEQVLKEYVSVLGDGFRASSNRPQGVPSVSSHTAYHGHVPFASSLPATLACEPAVNSGVERMQDCEVVFISSGKGGDKTNLATVFGSSVQKDYRSDERRMLQAIDNRMDQTTAPSSSAYGNNVYNPHPNIVRTGLRPIVIDGSNVAMGHTNGRIFSCRGLQICIDYFLERCHKVVAFVPQFRTSRFRSQDTEILTSLEKQGLVTLTPSRKIGNNLVVSYDDRFIVQYAAESGGVIVSTDTYRDLLAENPTWKETIEKRLLMFTWVGDVLMFPQDPLGRYGPNLETFLKFPSDECAEPQ